MTLFPKVGILVFGVLMVFCACSQGLPGNPPQAPETVSQGNASSEQTPESRPADPAPAAVGFGMRFLEALQRGDIAEMETMVWSWEETPDALSYWETVTFGDTFTASFVTEQTSEDYAVIQVSLSIEDPGESPLVSGENQLVLTVGCPPFGIGEDVRVLSLIPQAEYDLNRSEDPAAFQVWTFRSWGSIEPFGTAAQIDRNILLNYVVTAASRDFSTHTDGWSYEPLEELTQAQIDQTADRYFGIERLVRTDAACYDREKQVYRLFGRDGGYSSDRVVSNLELPDGNREVVIGQFGSDPLELLPHAKTRYLLAPNGDGSYRFLSATQEVFQP